MSPFSNANLQKKKQIKKFSSIYLLLSTNYYIFAEENEKDSLRSRRFVWCVGHEYNLVSQD
jgi:hypothetical protein